MAVKDDDALITFNPKEKQCDCCEQFKLCHLYSIYIGAKWICDECRRGKNASKERA